MSNERKLQIELVPRPLWGKSLKSTLMSSEWDRIRKTVYRRQGYKCGICGTGGRMLCHEQWEYDDDNCTQTLTGFIAVCDDCNNCIHMGRASAVLNEADFNGVLTHYAKVNGCSVDDAKQDYQKALIEWHERSIDDWTTVVGDHNVFLQNEGR